MARSERKLSRIRTERWPKSHGTVTAEEHRVTAEQWTRIELAARERQVSPNQLVVELAIEALDRREWPSTEAETKVARASLFVAQALARDLIAAGRKQEVQEIREFISMIVPSLSN